MYCSFLIYLKLQNYQILYFYKTDLVTFWRPVDQLEVALNLISGFFNFYSLKMFHVSIVISEVKYDAI